MKSAITILTCSTFLAGFIIFFSGVPARSAEDKVIELKFASHVRYEPDISWLTWAKEIEKRTKGRVKITFYLGGSLLKPKAIRVATIKGQCDISFSALAFDASAYPLNMVLELPFMGYPNMEVATRIRREIIDKFPEVRAEYKGSKIMWVQANLARYLHSTKKPIITPKDVKGSKIAAFGPSTRIAEAIGGSPVPLMPNDLYMGLERGVAEAWIGPYAAMRGTQITKLLPYHNSTILSMGGNQVLMSMKTWNKLPPDIQKVFNDINPEFGARAEFERSLRLDAMALSDAEELGHTFIKNTPEEVAAWQEIVKPLHEKWITGAEAKGLPARAVYDEVKRLIREYSK